MGESSGDKSEAPTPHKLREARKKGQVVKSKEITTAFLVLVSYNVLKSNASKMFRTIFDFFQYDMSFVSQTLEASVFGALLKKAQSTFFSTLAPIFLSIVATAIILEALQTQFNYSLEPLKPKLSKINPISGFKKMFSLKGFVELIKSLLKMGIVIYIMQKAIQEDMERILTVCMLPVGNILTLVGEIIMKVVTRVGIFYLAIAFFDYFYQRYNFMKDMKMSKQEVKEEYKKLEGDPQVKQRQRSAMREAAMSRGMGGVPSADVVVTNPVHIAVAIKYNASVMLAPQVVAKGQRKNAQVIKRLAEENNVPIVEKVELARAIFKTTEIGDDVPYDLFRAVAEVLAFVYDVKKKRKENSSGG